MKGMFMKPFIIRIETYGLKNIEKKITIDFNNSTINEKFSLKHSNIKAIYGVNGSGKSAFINSIDLYKNIIIDREYLSQKENIRMLFTLINQRIKRFYFKAIYAYCDKNLKIKSIFSHEILLKINDDYIVIESEVMSKLTDKSINGNYTELYRVNNGELKSYVDKRSNIFEHLKEKSLNMLDIRTLASIFNNKSISQEIARMLSNAPKGTFFENESTLLGLLSLQLLMINLFIYLDKSDVHIETDINGLIEWLNNERTKYIHQLNPQEERIYVKDILNYENQIQRLCLFLKIFKPNLEEIIIEKKIDNDIYHCMKILNYGDYKIYSEYESTGIKKLMTLFSFFEKAANGGCVFIDELDANLNGIYLEKMIEYLLEYGKGQLCYTIHNTDSMDTLSKMKGSLYFLGETGKLVPWAKCGNYSPLKRYKEGMINDSPFNISSIDFLKVFEMENNE